MIFFLKPGDGDRQPETVEGDVKLSGFSAVSVTLKKKKI